MYEDRGQHLPLTVEEYESLRGKPRHFAIVKGHDVSEVETVVEANQRYAIVEKIGAGGPVAEQLDPRRRKRRSQVG